MDIVKSSRHQKIIGDFGESLVCNWLSRSGFEVMVVDHTGIDIIAYNPSTSQRLGITVKSRTRNIGKEVAPVYVFYSKKEDRQKLLDACKAFACEPWIAIYVETTNFADVYLTSLDNYDSKYRGQEGRAIDSWKMSEKDKQRYIEDAEVKHVRIKFLAESWSW